MATKKSLELARRARVIYDEKLRRRLESSNLNDFLAVEPDSGDFFLGKTLSEAIQSARAAHPNRLPFVFRIGHETAVELGTIGL